MVPDSPLEWVKEARTIAVGEAVQQAQHKRHPCGDGCLYL